MRRFGLRSKLLAVASVFLLVPWLGFEYIRELERFLRQAQEEGLVTTAQAVATALHERGQLFTAPVPERWGTLRDMLDTVAARESVTPLPAGEPTEEIQQILRGLERATAQIWVIDRSQQVRARTGSLRLPVPAVAGGGPDPDAAPDPLSRPLTWFRKTALSPLYALILRQPREDFIDDLQPAYGPELEAALNGVLATGKRATRDGAASVAFAMVPVWVGDQVRGVVVAEQTTNSVLRQRNIAFERLFGVLLLVVLGGAALLFVFASRLGRRVRALRDDARAAVDAEGRVIHPLASSAAGDELGDLSREFAAVLRRLADHAQYREHLASRLSHELRTPIAMIRSSLENLQLAATAAEAKVYVERAHQGLARLTFIFDAMSEAARLESAIANTPRERFDLNQVVGACLEAYRSIYPAAQFEANLPALAAPALGSGELFAQLLDKLVGNAVDFATPGTAIAVTLDVTSRASRLRVANRGPALPPGAGERLFESMYSARPTGAATPHLGLGLHVARLIAQFHQGTIAIADTPDASGVVVTVEIPLAL